MQVLSLLVVLLAAAQVLCVVAVCEAITNTASSPLFEVGSVTVTDEEFVQVEFSVAFTTPPVVTTMAYGSDLATTRIRSVTTDGFEVVLVRPRYELLTNTLTETVSFFAMEQGVRTIGGAVVEARSIDTAAFQYNNNGQTVGTFETVPFSACFSSPPAVLSTVQTMNSDSSFDPAIKDHASPFLEAAARGVSVGEVQLSLERSETATQSETVVEETIGYIALTTGSFTDSDSCDANGNDLIMQVVSATASSTAAVETLTGFTSTPEVIGSLNSRNGNGGWLTQLSKSSSTVEFLLQEDQTKDLETTSNSASMAFVAFSATGSANSAPVLSNAVVPEVVAEGEMFTVSATAFDRNAGDLRFFVRWGDTDTSSVVHTNNATPESVSLTHQYATDGEYEVILLLSDECGKFDRYVTKITVQNAAPTVTVTSPLTGLEGEVFWFNATVSDGASDIPEITISWGDGTADDVVALPAGGGEISEQHTYADNNGVDAYLLQVSATDSVDSAVDVYSVQIDNKAPEVTLVGDAAVTVNQGEELSLELAIADVVADAAEFSYTINWGEGETSGTIGTNGFVFFTYNAIGTFSVEATVIDKDGSATTAVIAEVTVENVAPAVNIVSLVDGKVAVSADGTGTIALQIDEPGNHTVTIDWGDGVVETFTSDEAFSTFNHLFMNNPPQQNLESEITITVTDSDGGQTVVTATAVGEIESVPVGLSLTVATEGDVAVFTVRNTDSRGIAVNNVAVNLDMADVTLAEVIAEASERGRVVRTSSTTARWPVGRVEAGDSYKLTVRVVGGGIVVGSVETDILQACHASFGEDDCVFAADFADANFVVSQLAASK